jgi:lipoprotein-releasing system ATP-binding protein
MGEFNAVENVMMPLLMRRESSSRADEKARELLSFVGLSHRTEHKPGELSGGEQQRVALARALVSEPKVLLADEPTGNLDEDTGLEIVELIKRYNKETSATILLVTHNQRVAGLFRKRLNLDRHGILWV